MARSPTETIRFLTLEELARLFAAVRASARDRALFLIAYRHGLRASEVGLLRTDDIDFRALRVATDHTLLRGAAKAELAIARGAVSLPYPREFGSLPLGRLSRASSFSSAPIACSIVNPEGHS